MCVMSIAQAKDILITASSGESFIMDVEASTPFLDVVEQIECFVGDSGTELEMSYTLGLPHFSKKPKSQKGPRNFANPVSPAEKESIRYILTSLAKYNWIQLAKEESSLKKTGDKIDHIHPFRFLECVFTDEELKAALHAVRNKSLVWGNYYDGMRDSLSDESDANNLVQFVPDFANRVGVNINDILPLVQSRQWSVFINYLIDTVPRQGGSGRYDM